MYLPVLLVRDFGAWSFAVFALPNCLGAAAMGWTLRRPGASEALVARHGAACRVFSLVTIAFQWFFLWWTALGSEGTRLPALALVAGVVVLLATGRVAGEARRPRWLAAGLFAASLACAAWFLLTTDLSIRPPAPLFPASDLAALAPVVFFGFLLCPYLDLTFHQARQQTAEREGVTAFLIGFGVLFAIMILFTLLYAPALLGTAAGIGAAVVPALAPLPILLHLGMQLGFTIGLHRGHVDAEAPASPARLSGGLSIAALFVGLGAAAFARYAPPHAGLPMGEVVYRAFLAFYGLASPAYVWLCVIPRGVKATWPSVRSLAVFAGAVAVAAPFYWLGFIERQTWWLLPGLAVVLLARLAIPWQRAVPTPVPPSS